jgi:RNA polymerase sigma-70 factor (ECF subfamily)
MNDEALEHDDQAIINRVRDGDVNAYESLIERHRSDVFAIVRNHVPAADAEEVAHDVFVRAFKSLPRYAPRKPFSHWLSRIAVRACHDFWRKRGRSRETAVSQLGPEHEDWMEGVWSGRARDTFEREQALRVAREVLDSALAMLSADDRMALTLVHLEGHTVREAADVLGWGQAKVKVRAHRARQKLRAWIGKHIND